MAYGKLDDLKNNNRNNLKEIDQEENRKLFDYKFDEISIIKNEVEKYSNIRIWVDRDDSNCYLLPLYFISEFYDNIHDLKIFMIYIDSFRKKSDSLISIYDELNGTEKELSKDELKHYDEEWKKQLAINSEIRNVVDGEIINLSYIDLYDKVFNILKPLKRISRAKAIIKLMESNVLNGGLPIIYNYIINCLSEEGKVKFYIRKDIDENDQFYNDEIRNNEIECVG